MFNLSSENYVWNLATRTALTLGGALSEIDEACRPLKEASARNDKSAQKEWFESWNRVAQRVNGIAFAHEKAGQHLSAGNKYFRASLYFFMAERMLLSEDPRKIETYRQGLAAFRKAMQFRKEPIEWVDIPFQGKSLPSLFTKGSGEGRLPCMIHFDGFDWLKEYSYIRTAEEFRRRGISLLVVDHPGVGEALRLHDMHSGPDAEVSAATCVDYLETRGDVDPGRIGIMAQSLGGYYAPRAAAFEKRLKACVAWGACWDRWELNEKYFESYLGKGTKLQASLPDYLSHHLWVAGKKTIDEAIELAKKYTLDGVADKITCPLLVLHGENDRQVPLSHAQRTIDAAINSPNKRLKIFTADEGGVEHCQGDNPAMAVDYIADWAAEILGGYPKGV